MDIPEDLYEALRRHAAAQRTSIRSLVIGAIQGKYRMPRKRAVLTGPPLPGKGKPGPRCPDRENPYDILFG